MKTILSSIFFYSKLRDFSGLLIWITAWYESFLFVLEQWRKCRPHFSFLFCVIVVVSFFLSMYVYKILSLPSLYVCIYIYIVSFLIHLYIYISLSLFPLCVYIYTHMYVCIYIYVVSFLIHINFPFSTHTHTLSFQEVFKGRRGQCTHSAIWNCMLN